MLVADLVGFAPAEPAWSRRARDHDPTERWPERWRRRRKPWRGSATWRYLSDERALPEADSPRRN